MNALKLLFADAALTDILEQSDWYERQSGGVLVSRWENAVAGGIESVVKIHLPELGANSATVNSEIFGAFPSTDSESIQFSTELVAPRS